MANWRDTYRPARFFMIDARIGYLILAVLLYASWLTFIPTVAVAVILFWVEKRMNMDVSSAIRAVRSWMAGPIREARPSNKKLRFVDYERR